MIFSKRRGILFIAIFLVLLTVSGIVAINFFEAADYVYGNTASNISNFGLMCESGDYIYFSNTEDMGKLYRMRTDGTGYKKLSDDEAQYINVVENTLYYSNLSDGGSVYSVSTDGAGRKKLIDTNAFYLTVVDDHMYYLDASDGWTIKRCLITGSSPEYVGNKIKGASLNVQGEYIYYIGYEDSLIYRMEAKSGNIACISSAQASQIVVYNDYVFYINSTNERVCRINTSGASNQKVYVYTDYKCGHLAVYDEILYFSMIDKGGIIGSLEIGDFYSDTDVSNIFGACINTVKGHIYFCNVYEVNSGFIYYGSMHRITYDGKVTDNMDDFFRAAEVMSMIEALPLPENVTASDKENIENAMNAYDRLTEEQKKYVKEELTQKLMELEESVEAEAPEYIVSSIYTVDRENHIVRGLTAGTSVSEAAAAFKGNNSSGIIKIYNGENKEVSSGIIGTGFKVRLVYGGKTIEELEAVVLGDVSGDGVISSIDLLNVQKHLLRISLLEGVHMDAADVNRDGNVSSVDLLNIQKHLLRIITIEW